MKNIYKSFGLPNDVYAFIFNIRKAKLDKY